MKARAFPFPPPWAPQPPDILQILQDVKALQASLGADVSAAEAQFAKLSQQIAALTLQVTALTAHFDARFDTIDAADKQIEEDLNPTIPPVLPLAYRSATTMAIVSTINLTAGGASDGVQFVDSSTPPQVFPGAQVTWSVPVGEANASDLGVTLNSDGFTFQFLAPASAPAESVTLFATWTDPTGVQAPIVGPSLTVNIAAPVETFVAPGQYSEVSGS